jgi:hypothetical protein
MQLRRKIGLALLIRELVKKVISPALWSMASYFALCVGATSVSVACDFPQLNVVMDSTGSINIDRQVIQCDSIGSSITVNLVDQNTPPPVNVLTLLYEAGPAPIITFNGSSVGPQGGLFTICCGGVAPPIPITFQAAGQYVFGAVLNSGFSNAVTFVVTVGGISAPTSLQATQLGFNGTQILLTWNYGSNSINGFSIQSQMPSSGAGNWPLLTTLPVGSVCSPSGSALVCSYIDTNVPPFATTSYRLNAYQGTTSSGYSNAATAYQLQTITLPPNGSVIEAKYTPDPTLTVKGAAGQLPPDDVTLAVQPPKFDHFNWISYTEHDPQCYVTGTQLHGWQPGSPPTEGAPQLAPHVDPPVGGYYENNFYGNVCNGQPCQGPSDALPFYWNENPNPPGTLQPWYLDTTKSLSPGGDLVSSKSNAGGDPSQVQTTQFYDQPMDECLPGSPPDYFGFLTTLVGVNTPIGAQSPNFTPLAAFVWHSTYNAKGGGISGISESNFGPPVSGGTGGVFNVATVNVNNLPNAVRQQLIQAGAQGVSTAPYVDTNAPMTTSFLSGPQGTNGWYMGAVSVSLIATDIDGGSDVTGTSYNVDGGASINYTGPFRVLGDGIHTIQFGSTDLSGNVETPRPSQTIKVDATPPNATCTANPNILWPPNGKTVAVTVSGTITDAASGVDPSSATFAVNDEYGQVQPSGGLTLGPGGSYSFGISLIASRNGNDLDGRSYTISVTAKDYASNVGSCSAVVTVPHDQGH